MNPNAIPFEPQGPMFMRPMLPMGSPNNCMVRPMGPHNHMVPPVCFQPMPPPPNHMMVRPIVLQNPMAQQGQGFYRPIVHQPPMGYYPIEGQQRMENHYRGKQPARLTIPPNRASPSRSKTPIEECQENKLSPDSRLWKWVSWAILGSKIIKILMANFYYLFLFIL